jgi:hypothetical protein
MSALAGNLRQIGSLLAGLATIFAVFVGGTSAGRMRAFFSAHEILQVFFNPSS